MIKKKIKVWYHGFTRGHAIFSYSCPYCFAHIDRPEDGPEMHCPRCDEVITLYDRPRVGREVQ